MKKEFYPDQPAVRAQGGRARWRRRSPTSFATDCTLSALQIEAVRGQKPAHPLTRAARGLRPGRRALRPEVDKVDALRDQGPRAVREACARRSARASSRSSSPAGSCSARNLTLLFENHETVLFQIQEMMRTERIVEDAKIQDEIDTYNALIPGRASCRPRSSSRSRASSRMTHGGGARRREPLPGARRRPRPADVGGHVLPARFEAGETKRGEDGRRALRPLRWSPNGAGAAGRRGRAGPAGIDASPSPRRRGPRGPRRARSCWPTCHEQGPAGGVQRRRDRDPDHDHGAGAEGAPRGHARSVAPAVARDGQLRPELRLPRDLLEQPPPPAAGDAPRERPHPVGEPAPAVLALARAVRDGLDGREPLRAAGGGRVRRACCSSRASRTTSWSARSSRAIPTTRCWPRPSGPTSRASCPSRSMRSRSPSRSSRPGCPARSTRPWRSCGWCPDRRIERALASRT